MSAHLRIRYGFQETGVVMGFFTNKIRCINTTLNEETDTVRFVQDKRLMFMFCYVYRQAKYLLSFPPVFYFSFFSVVLATVLCHFLTANTSC